jgi:tetratricopeptide (TPR) repeat protein
MLIQPAGRSGSRPGACIPIGHAFRHGGASATDRPPRLACGQGYRIIMATAGPPAPSAVEADVLRVRSLLEQGAFGQALDGALALALRVPDNRDVLYMAAVAQRYLRRPADALETLARLEAAHPAYSRAFQERGHCCVAMGDPAGALAAYLTAVNLNPALPASWQALSALFRACGRHSEAADAAGHVAKLASLAPAVVTASSMFADGEVHAAEGVIRGFLKEHPTDVEAMRLLARIGMHLDVMDDAEFILESVLAFAPGYHLARYDYVRVLLHRHRNAKALEESRTLLHADPANRDYRAVYATACLALARYDEAIAMYRALLHEAPAAADLHLSIGHALKTLGRQQEAITAYQAAAHVRPSFGDAYWSLANLKTYRFTQDEIARMRAEEAAAPTGPADRYHLCFALGKALEDRGEYAESFTYYARGNALKKAELQYRPEVTERHARRQTSLLTRAFFIGRAGVGCPSADPIFVVGLPRAGSTLIEQILASHTQVEGTMELADIPRLVLRLQGRTHDDEAPLYPGVLAELSAKTLRELGETYLADTRIYRTGKPFFIDKNPNNFRHLGLIHLILPNARIIDARREAMACCFSNFKQLFASGQEFTYDLRDIARYYRCYLALMEHWQAALPGKILRVQHEDVVADLEGSVRRLLAFCGLPFERSCVDFHETARSVRTASSEQVRQPIFKDGLDQWHNFEPWLGTLKDALADTHP